MFNSSNAFKYKISTKQNQQSGSEVGLSSPITAFTEEETAETLTSQSSPSAILTFVRWDVRDTLRSNGNPYLLKGVREPIVVVNDCIQISTSMDKSSHTPSMSCVLLETDTNYMTAIAPGDFVFVNILNWENKADEVAKRISGTSSQPINNFDDGFKGLYKIQSVRKSVSVNQDTGAKMVIVRISGFAFTEFNSTAYYNPYMGTSIVGTGKDSVLFPTNLKTAYDRLAGQYGAINCQNIIKALIEALIGTGITSGGITSVGNAIVTPNSHYHMPAIVGQLLGVYGVQSAKDIYNYLFGVQKYSSGPFTTIEQGFNPTEVSGSGFMFTPTKVLGKTALKPEYWNGTNVWSILNQYVNSPLNELYTCFRLDPSGKVMPTVVYRQIPFTSEDFGKSTNFSSLATTTKFLELPRWEIDPALIFDLDIGREEAARVNFVQYYGTVTSSVKGATANQTAAGNYVYDANDVQRSGLKPYIINSSFEDFSGLENGVSFGSNAKKAAQIIGDAVMGGHLKLNGTIVCKGISEPITVGDNIEYDGMVFHIEGVTHNFSQNPGNGARSFRTTLKLSNGVQINENGFSLAYPEMEYANAYSNRKNDYKNNGVLPGISEEQNIASRNNNPSPSSFDINRPDKPFDQPGSFVKPKKGVLVPKPRKR